MQKDIEISGKHFSTIGTLYQRSSKTLIITCFGYMITRERIGERAQEFLIDNGPSVFLYDPFIYLNADFSNKYHPLYETLVEELGAIIEYFVKNYKYKTIILEGISLGGAIATIAATRYKGISALITLNGCFDIKSKPITHLFFKYTPLLRRNYKPNSDYYYSHFFPKKIKIPTFVIHGKSDRIVGYKQSEIFFNQLTTKTKELIFLDNVNHYLTRPKNLEVAREAMIAWLKKTKLHKF